MSLQTRLEALVAAIGADIKALQAASGGSGGGAGSLDVVKAVSVDQPSSNGTSVSSILDLETVLEPGTYEVKVPIVWYSSSTANGGSFFTNCSGGSVALNVGHVYTTTTGVTATTGVADQATVAGAYQMLESRAWRANNVDPGPFSGVDSSGPVNVQFSVLECNLIVTATTTLQIMFRSEVSNGTTTIAPGTTMKIIKTL